MRFDHSTTNRVNQCLSLGQTKIVIVLKQSARCSVMLIRRFGWLTFYILYSNFRFCLNKSQIIPDFPPQWWRIRKLKCVLTRNPFVTYWSRSDVYSLLTKMREFKTSNIGVFSQFYFCYFYQVICIIFLALYFVFVNNPDFFFLFLFLVFLQ